MKKITLLAIAFLISFGASESAAQFNIKIPKINKPKVEQPKTDGNSTNAPTDSDSNQNSPKKSNGAVGYMAKPRGTSTPVLLKDTLEVKPYTANTYWKFPKEQNYSSWMPLISFDIFHDGSETVRYTVEWLNPDGSLWFSEAIDGTKTRYSGEIFDTKSTNATGTFGFRLLNTKTKELVFQGKYNVKKIPLNPGEPRYKNQMMFYTDQDWLLPFGYVGFEDNASWEKDPEPTVYVWFKGDLKREDLEARLFYNNQQISSTDDAVGRMEDGSLGYQQRNQNNCFQFTETCGYRMWKFTWKLKVESFNQAATAGTYVRYPDSIYTKDKPGEYTVKIFHKGVQVRELKFSVQPNGYLAANNFASQIPLNNYKVLVPVKIMGTLDKWNPTAWKTEAFFGNPVSGFVAP